MIVHHHVRPHDHLAVQRHHGLPFLLQRGGPHGARRVGADDCVLTDDAHRGVRVPRRGGVILRIDVDQGVPDDDPVVPDGDHGADSADLLLPEQIGLVLLQGEHRHGDRIPVDNRTE